MTEFQHTSHLSEILEHSHKEPVVIFKFSTECNSSKFLQNEFKNSMDKGELKNPIYLVTVQTQKVLSGKIEEMFHIKHESPQVFVIYRSQVLWTEHHRNITMTELLKKLQI